MLLEVVKSLIHDGYTALMDQRCHSAEQMFSQLLNIIDPSELKVNWINLCIKVIELYAFNTVSLFPSTKIMICYWIVAHHASYVLYVALCMSKSLKMREMENRVIMGLYDVSL